MTRIDVVIDRDDSLETVRAVRDLKRRWPHVLVVATAPGSRSETDVSAAVLRALGKRLNTLRRRPGWLDLGVWLAAHGITELVMLCAQHLDKAAIGALTKRVHEEDLDLTLIYGGGRNSPKATTTREYFLSRPRVQQRGARLAPSYPDVPDAHSLRFRYECAHALTADEFATVDEVLRATWQRMSFWLRTHPGENRDRLEQAVALARVGTENNHSRIRRHGVLLALIDAEIAAPDTFADALHCRCLTADDVDDALSQINPQAAGHRLVELLTGMPPDLLQVVGGDQVGPTTILGHTVPERAWPILRALNPRPEAKLEPPVRAASLAAGPTDASARRRSSRRDRRLAQALGQILDGPRGCVGLRSTNPDTRADLNRLVRLGIVTRDEHVYRPTAAALYSDYRLLSPPPPPLTSSNRTADIS